MEISETEGFLFLQSGTLVVVIFSPYCCLVSWSPMKIPLESVSENESLRIFFVSVE